MTLAFSTSRWMAKTATHSSAGTTGAGKTRLLESLVLSLAATRSPAELNVLVIDFKGGNELAGIARVAALRWAGQRSRHERRSIALWPRSPARSLAATRFSPRVGRTDLSDYSAEDGRGLASPGRDRRRVRSVPSRRRAGWTRRHAAARRRAGTVKGLAPRVGHAVAVAPTSRRRSGKTSGVRMCLRVAEAAESVAVLGVPDAARLPGPGHVLVAHDNELRTGQRRDRATAGRDGPAGAGRGARRRRAGSRPRPTRRERSAHPRGDRAYD